MAMKDLGVGAGSALAAGAGVFAFFTATAPDAPDASMEPTAYLCEVADYPAAGETTTVRMEIGGMRLIWDGETYAMKPDGLAFSGELVSTGNYEHYIALNFDTGAGSYESKQFGRTDGDALKIGDCRPSDG
ncbi:MAG: hypothetical protein AAGC95_16055 [Pseudomonadota bacterium]